jgi:hypothetical protein
LGEFEASVNHRLATGVMKPEADWPGVSIPRDEAVGYANRLHSLFLPNLKREPKAGDISREEIAACAELKTFGRLVGIVQRKDPVRHRRAKTALVTAHAAFICFANQVLGLLLSAPGAPKKKDALE